MVSFRSYPTGNRIFQKNSKKIQKLENTVMGSFQSKIGRKSLRNRQIQNYRSVSFLFDA